MVAVAVICDCGFEVVSHPLIHQICPSDFHLFPKMRKPLAGRHFANDNEVMRVVEEFLGFQQEFFSSGIKALQHRWGKCVALEGDYVEK